MMYLKEASEVAKKTFAEFDKNNDGYLTKDELKPLLEKLSTLLNVFKLIYPILINELKVKYPINKMQPKPVILLLLEIELNTKHIVNNTSNKELTNINKLLLSLLLKNKLLIKNIIPTTKTINDKKLIIGCFFLVDFLSTISSLNSKSVLCKSL